MPKVSYKASVKDAIIKAAADAREAGKSWKDAFEAAKKAGYQGSVKSIAKLLQAMPRNETAGSQRAPKTRKTRIAIKAQSWRNSPINTCPVTAASANSAAHLDSSLNTAVQLGVSREPRLNAPADAISELSNKLPVLRDGTKYARPISLFDGPFHDSRAGEIVAWARILDKEEALCVVNSHDQYSRGADIVVDSTLNPPGSMLTVILNTAQNLDPQFSGTHPVGSQIPVERRWDGTAFVAIRDVGPAASLVLTNRPAMVCV
ncbi:MAG TPA: hypothetical protein VKX17_24085 [Planctomycetota bacterium]|nr:hypothetical protein [Planctomycetota bacterium]